MRIEPCTLNDYQHILAHIADFWGGNRTLSLHHPMFVHEFGDSAFVIHAGKVIAAYLFGMYAQTSPTAYVHLVAVRKPYRRHGYARKLYAHFIDVARARGCRWLKAITTPGNSASVAFHRSLSMELQGSPNADGVPVVRDYAGPGQDRVVMIRALGNS